VQVAIALALAVISGCGNSPALVMAPNLYVDSTEDPYAAVPEELKTNTVTVVYATDRQHEVVDDVFGYNAKRSRITAFGLCTVRMGRETTTWEQLAEASRTAKRPAPIALALTNIDERGRFPALGPAVELDGRWVDDPAWVAASDRETVKLHAILSEQLAKTPRKELYVFVHGYNNTFAAGAFRIAQIWHYCGRGGVPVMFSWPAGSSGVLQGYTRDRESGEFANPHLRSFLKELASCPDVKKIHLIAHSRGTDILGTAVRELHIEHRGGGRDTRKELKLGQIILAAPDIDLDVFLERFSADRVGFVGERLTIYVSHKDKAIGLANWLFGSVRRIGQLAFGDLPKDLSRAAHHHPLLDIVDMRARTDRTGHGYFLSSPACLSDVILVLRDNVQPGDANGRPLFDNPVGFWELYDGYPTDNTPKKKHKAPKVSAQSSEESNAPASQQ